MGLPVYRHRGGMGLLVYTDKVKKVKGMGLPVYIHMDGLISPHRHKGYSYQFTDTGHVLHSNCTRCLMKFT